jgi:hypothetical protein
VKSPIGEPDLEALHKVLKSSFPGKPAPFCYGLHTVEVMICGRLKVRQSRETEVFLPAGRYVRYESGRCTTFSCRKCKFDGYDRILTAAGGATLVSPNHAKVSAGRTGLIPPE